MNLCALAKVETIPTMYTSKENLIKMNVFAQLAETN